MEGQQLLLYLQGNIFLTNANLYTIPHSFFAPPRKPFRIGILFAHKDGDFGAISGTERKSAAPISKVKRHISDRFCVTF